MPDHYYSGNTSDLWAEYKYYAQDRDVFNLLRPAKTPKLTKLQQNWLNSRLREGREVWVIVGMPSGGVILKNQTWMKEVTITRLLSRKEIAEEILRVCA